jgi:hypothetical protein
MNVSDNAAAQHASSGVCPRCGRCPYCGSPNPLPFAPYPLYPYTPYPSYPYGTTPITGPVWTICNTGGTL